MFQAQHQHNIDNPWELEELFGYVRRHLLTQNFVCRHGEGEACAYRSEDGKMACAVGAIIPNALYDERIEGNSLSALFRLGSEFKEREVDKMPVTQILIKCGVPNQENFWRVLQCLQDIHDYTEPHRWEQELDDLWERVQSGELFQNPPTPHDQMPFKG